MVVQIYYTEDNMKPLSVLGLTIFSISGLALVGFGLYKFLLALWRNNKMPLMAKVGIVGLILGVIIILISFIVERLREKED